MPSSPLVAYRPTGIAPGPVVPRRIGAHGWQAVWEARYQQAPAGRDAQFDISTWLHCDSGATTSESQMRAWVLSTVGQIQKLSPKRVLEIGCGTGLLLFRLAPTCESYVGLDFVQEPLDRIAGELKQQAIGSVSLVRGTADELSAFTPGSFDTIVINSVSQYFPSIEYLIRVLAHATELLSAGGSIFLGDVRSLPLLEAFYASVELARAAPELSREALRHNLERRHREDDELAVDPKLFSALERRIPALDGVEVRLKQGADDSELTRFRYDVVLRKAGGPRLREPRVTTLSTERFALGTVRLALREYPELLRVVGVPNARVAAATKLLALLCDEQGPATVGELQKATESMRVFEPNELTTIDPHYDVDLAWSEAGADRFDLLLRRRGTLTRFPVEPVGAEKPWAAYGNSPARPRRATKATTGGRSRGSRH